MMFGPFRLTKPLFGGLLWKTPWRISSMQKRRQRKRLRAVDNVVDVVNNALIKNGHIRPLGSGETFKIASNKEIIKDEGEPQFTTIKQVERWKAEMPREEEMLAKDKYTIFDRKVKRYRKGIHSESSCIREFSTVSLMTITQSCRSGRESASD